MKIKYCFLLLLISLLFTAGSLHAEVTATATLSSTRFSLDDAAQLTVNVQGIRSSQVHMPEVDGLQFQQRGQSTRMEYVNGVYSASVSSLYQVDAIRVGKFTIPPIKVSTKDGDLYTAAIKLEVTDAKTATSSRPSGQGNMSTTRLRSGESDEVAFLRVSPVKNTSYSGEVVPVRIKAYFRDGIQANLNSLPQITGEGFVLQQLEGEPLRMREVVGNEYYTVLTWDFALSGIKEGKHVLSMELDATLLLRQQQRDPFGRNNSFFGDFFSSYREKEVKVASPNLEMEVLSLPEEGRPENFSGAIGDFRLQVKADPLKVSQGDPVTLTMTVSGQGNFDRVQAPQLQGEEGWKTYTPSSEFLKDGDDHHGKKVFEQAIVAKASNLTEIPAITFSYFDPESKSYKSLVSSPVPLQVQEVVTVKKEVEPQQGKVQKSEEQSVAPAQVAVQQAIPGLAPLQLDSSNMNQTLEPLFAKKWFQFLCAALLLVILAAISFKVRMARLAANPKLQRQQAMKQLLVVREKEIAARLENNDSHGFLATCRSTIQEQLGLLWETEAAAITLADLQKRLSPDSILVAIFRAAEESAYSGQELSTQQMQDCASGLKKELEIL
jgi:hypothetical protein